MKKCIFINFQGLSVAKNYLRPETVPLTILGIKRELLRNFTKNFIKSRHFIENSATGL